MVQKGKITKSRKAVSAKAHHHHRPTLRREIIIQVYVYYFGPSKQASESMHYIIKSHPEDLHYSRLLGYGIGLRNAKRIPPMDMSNAQTSIPRLGFLSGLQFGLDGSAELPKENCLFARLQMSSIKKKS